MPQYHLSRNQITDLIEGGKAITIALPLPPEFFCGDREFTEEKLRQWASKMLPPTIAVFIARVKVQDVLVSPMFSAKPATLTELLGSIQDDIRPDRFTYAIPSCVVTLDPPGRRGVSDRIQWPKDFMIAGKSVLTRTEAVTEKSIASDSPAGKPYGQVGASGSTAAPLAFRDVPKPENKDDSGTRN